MQGEADISVLRRKVRAAPPGPALTAMTPLKAMRLGAARAGEEALGCAVGLSEMDENTRMPDDVTDGMPNPGLVIRLQGHDATTGLAVLCPQAVAAIIEAQTMGRVLAAKAADRAPTRTDAMLVTEFLDLLLAGFAGLVAKCKPAPPVAGFGYAEPLADLRSGIMTLRDAEHLHYAVTLDFAKGAKTGSLHLVIPAQALAGAATDTSNDLDSSIRHAVLGSAAAIRAILCRQKFSLSRVTGFAVGDVLRLDQASLDNVVLTGPGGATLIRARLGRSGAMRAVRLTLGPPEAPKLAEELPPVLDPKP